MGEGMKEIEAMMYSNAALAHSMTFKGMNPFQVDTLCETLFVELERFIVDRLGTRSRTVPLNVAEYKHVHILGMRKFHLKQIYAQKVSYDSFCEAQRLLASMPIELTDEEKKEHRKKFKRIFDELEQPLPKTAVKKRA